MEKELDNTGTGPLTFDDYMFNLTVFTIMVNTDIISLSHTDLDGYGSQYVIDKALSGMKNIEYLNADYHELTDYLNMIDSRMLGKNTLLLVTDLNFNDEQIEICNKMINRGMTVIVIDHHITKSELANNAPWYFVDPSYCATYWTYKHFSKYYPNAEVEKIAEKINIYDTWIKEEHEQFWKTSLVSNVVFDNHFEVPSIRREYNFYMIENLFNVLEHCTTEEAELSYINGLTNEFLLSYGKEFNIEQLSDANIPLSTKCALTTLSRMDDYLVGEIVTNTAGTIKVYNQISSKTSQYCFDAMFDDESNLDKVLVKVNHKGGLSIRSRNEKASLIASRLNGGGHANAAGGSVSDPDDIINIIKEAVKDL